MRLRIAHSIVRRYDPPATSAIQVLRLTPRNHEGQYVIDGRIDVSADARLVGHEDAFGNLTHVFTADGPLEELSVTVDGEVETQDTDGLIRGAVERFPSLPRKSRRTPRRRPPRLLHESAASPRIGPTSSSAPPAASVFQPAMSPATSAPAQRRSATTLGRKPSLPI
jgi:transglutaminase-like putative cysteine protease